jgi:very-short-patch-repair endonuclease
MVHPRVYAVGAQPLVAHGRWYAALLACRPDPVLSHLSSAAKRGLAAERGAVHVTVSRRSPRELHAVTVHRCRRLDPADVERIDGMPVTTLARTFLDLAETEPFDRLRSIAEEAERRELLDLAAIEACIGRNPGRRGIAPLNALLADHVPVARTREGLEREFQLFLAERGLPQPLFNVVVAGLLVDCWWPEARFVVELDSRGFHGHWSAAERDRERDAKLLRLGIASLRVTDRRLRTGRPALAADIAALAERSRRSA